MERQGGSGPLPRAQTTRSQRKRQMIRFTCPPCGKRLKAEDGWVGRKTTCPRCGQRLLIPPPVQGTDKTMLGEVTSESVPLVDPLPEPGVVTTQTVAQVALEVLVPCPGCGRVITLPAHEVNLPSIECAACGYQFCPANPVIERRARQRTGVYAVLIVLGLAFGLALLIGGGLAIHGLGKMAVSPDPVETNPWHQPGFQPEARRPLAGKSDFLTGLKILFFLPPLVCIYFAPTVIAFARRHPNAPAICALNTLAGWICLGWI